MEGKPLGEVQVPGLGSAGIYGRTDRKEGVLYFSSYTTPYSIYRYDTGTGEKILWYRDSVPFQSERFETEQVWYPSKDGTKIPMFLMHRKGLKPDGNTPAARGRASALRAGLFVTAQFSSWMSRPQPWTSSPKHAQSKPWSGLMKGCTVGMIAHRLNTLRDAAEIIVFKNGTETATAKADVAKR